jgi:hypothetical protein
MVRAYLEISGYVASPISNQNICPLQMDRNPETLHSVNQEMLVPDYSLGVKFCVADKTLERRP